MPEFFPEHNGTDESTFLAGFLGAAEWLLNDDQPGDWQCRCLEGEWRTDERCDVCRMRRPKDCDPIDREKIRGWSRSALREAKADCTDFVKANSDKLEKYYRISDRDESSAGHDFYLSRCGHGAGFFDRGNDPVFDELQAAAQIYSGLDVYVSRGWMHFESA